MNVSGPEKNESEEEQNPKFCCNLCTLNTARSLILCIIIVTVATFTTGAIIAASTIRVSVCSLRSSKTRGPISGRVQAVLMSFQQPVVEQQYATTSHITK